MGLRRCVVPVVLALAAACGGGQGPDRFLSAAGGAPDEPPFTVVSTTSPATTSTVPFPVTTVTSRPATTTTTARRTQTTRAPVTATPPIAGYSPAPPPPGVEPDGYGGYGGVTTTSARGVTVRLAVYPREQYFGEIFQVSVLVDRPEGISVTSLKLDFGNGTVVSLAPQSGWYCGTAQAAGDGRGYTFPAPGTFRITATATVVNCMGGIPGGIWIGPHFPPPQGLIGPWFPEPHAAVSAGMDVLHRPDRPPLPVGPPPGP